MHIYICINVKRDKNIVYCTRFFCGFFLPIRAMSHFCLCAGFIALFNFITLVSRVGVPTGPAQGDRAI